MMHSSRGRLCRSGAVLVAVAAATFLCGLRVQADDPELPIPLCIIAAPTLTFGCAAVTTDDVGGSSIDARETIEPQLTVLATTDDLAASPSDTIVVNTQPVFSSQLASK